MPKEVKKMFRWDTTDPNRARLITEFLDNMGNGVYYFELKPSNIEKNAMYAYYYGVVLKMIIEECGYPLITAESLHRVIKHTINNDVTTTKQNKAQFWDFINKVRNWAGEFLNLAIPDPDPEWWKTFIDKENEKLLNQNENNAGI